MCEKFHFVLLFHCGNLLSTFQWFHLSQLKDFLSFFFFRLWTTLKRPFDHLWLGTVLLLRNDFFRILPPPFHLLFFIKLNDEKSKNLVKSRFYSVTWLDKSSRTSILRQHYVIWRRFLKLNVKLNRFKMIWAFPNILNDKTSRHPEKDEKF